MFFIFYLKPNESFNYQMSYGGTRPITNIFDEICFYRYYRYRYDNNLDIIFLQSVDILLALFSIRNPHFSEVMKTKKVCQLFIRRKKNDIDRYRIFSTLLCKSCGTVICYKIENFRYQPR